MNDVGLLERSSLVHKHTSELNFALKNLALSFQSLKKKFTELEKILKVIPLDENPFAMENNKEVLQALSFTTKYLEITQKKIGVNIPLDINKFSQQWKSLKKTTEKLYGKTTMIKLTNTFRKTKEMSGQDKIEKENSIRRNMKEVLFELNAIYEDFIYAMIFYHSKSLENWTIAYQQFQTRKKLKRKSSTLSLNQSTGELKEEKEELL